MKKKKYTLTTNECLNSIINYFQTCDSDELARLTGEIFGGECYQSTKDDDKYIFTPNTLYTREFD